MSSQEYLGALRRVATTAAVVAGLVLPASCGNSTGPTTTDVQAARAAWLQNKPANYTFEISSVSEWIPRTQYLEVTVENGVGTKIRDESGTELPHTMIPSMDDHWSRILEAAEAGRLKRAQFTAAGVPLEWFIDDDAWADDAYGSWVRNFRKR